MFKWLLTKLRDKCGWGCVENGGLNGLLVGIYIGATPMEYLLEISHKILQRTVNVATNPTSGYIFISEYKFKGIEIIISQREICTHIFIASIFTVA